MITNSNIHHNFFVFLIGPSGSGKSWLSKRLAKLLNNEIYDTDAIVESMNGNSIYNIFSLYGENYFRKLELKVIENILNSNNPGVVATGGGLPVINGIMNKLSNFGIIVYLEATIDELWNRLTVDRSELEKRPLLRKGGRNALEKMLTERLPVYTLAHITIRTDGISPEKLPKLVYTRIIKWCKDNKKQVLQLD